MPKRIYLVSAINLADKIAILVHHSSLADEEVEIVYDMQSADELVYLLTKSPSLADKAVFVTNPDMIPLWIRANM